MLNIISSMSIIIRQLYKIQHFFSTLNSVLHSASSMLNLSYLSWLNWGFSDEFSSNSNNNSSSDGKLLLWAIKSEFRTSFSRSIDNRKHQRSKIPVRKYKQNIPVCVAERVLLNNKILRQKTPFSIQTSSAIWLPWWQKRLLLKLAKMRPTPLSSLKRDLDQSSKKKSRQDYNNSEAAEETEELN